LPQARERERERERERKRKRKRDKEKGSEREQVKRKEASFSSLPPFLSPVCQRNPSIYLARIGVVE
jgi:hypothetical protein